MTLKQSYIQMRNTQKLDANFLYLYYKDKGGTFSKGQFTHAANIYDFNGLYDKLDSEFSVNIVFNKEGDFLKAFEQ